MTTVDERTVTRACFLEAMRSVASSVTIVTSDGPAGCHGATVSAFCSVSADPPSALVCLDARSRIAEIVRENRAFCVNVLPEDRADLSERFAGRLDSWIADRMAETHWSRSRHPAPKLPEATAFSCELVRTVTEGSHIVCIGRVTEVQIGAEAPLIYHQRTYRRLEEAHGGAGTASAAA